MKGVLIVGNPLFRKNLCSRLTALPSVVSCGYLEAGHEARLLQVGMVVIQISTEIHLRVLIKLASGTDNIGGISVPIWTPAYILATVAGEMVGPILDRATSFADNCLTNPKTDDIIHAILEYRIPVGVSNRHHGLGSSKLVEGPEGLNGDF